MSNDGEARRARRIGSADDISVNADFVAALAEDYAQAGPGAIEALRIADPARYLMMMVTVFFDDRYAAAFADAEE